MNSRTKTPETNRRALVERLLALLPPMQQPSYRRIASGDTAFAAAYRAADKSLPICAECGHNCRPIAANLSFVAEYWSHCCYAPIEQDEGAGDASITP
jgi:hypothetical protein